mgnify:CR=1 FL=1
MNQEKIGLFIAKLRQEKGLTQTELGDLLGVSYKAVSKWERGINLPDASLYKPLCDIFNITMDELMAGEIKKDIKPKSRKYLLIPIFLIIILCIILSNNNRKYPDITIDKIEVKKNNQNKLENLLLSTNDNIWYYNIDEVKVCTKNFTCYNLGVSLNHKQITIDKLKEYYHNESILNGIEKNMLFDGGTTIYKMNDYSVIFCNTLAGNKDIYFGPSDLVNILDGNYCGHDTSNRKYFTRTYKVLNIYLDDDNEYINITVSQFQSDVAMVRVKRIDNLEVNKNYEFKFYTYKVFNETIENIFNNSVIEEVKETDKVGLEQIQEPILVTKE